MTSKNVRKSRTTVEHINRCRRYTNNLGALLGAAILKDDYTPNIVTYFTLTFLFFMTCIEIYSIYIFSSDTFSLLQTLANTGFVLQSYAKFVVVLSSYEKMRSLYEFAEKVCSRNKKGPRATLIIASQDNIMRVAKYVLVITSISILIFGVYPFYKFIFEGEYELVLNIIFPGVDHETLFGYMITSTLLGIFSLYGVAGNMAFDFYFMMAIGNYIMFIDLLSESFDTLSEMWKKKINTERDRNFFFRNVILLYADIDNYLQELNGLVYFVVLFQVIGLSISVAIILFCIIANHWVGGVGFVLFVLPQFLLISYLGTIVQTQNNRMKDIVYSTTWYDFPEREQKIILMLLIRIDKIKEIWVGPFKPLNFETALDILKTIYQMLMMLLKTVE